MEAFSRKNVYSLLFQNISGCKFAQMYSMKCLFIWTYSAVKISKFESHRCLRSLIKNTFSKYMSHI